MNTSRKTRLIAEGIALYAAYQDIPHSKLDIAPEAYVWNEWAWNNKQWTALVMREQARLFDIVNAM